MAKEIWEGYFLYKQFRWNEKYGQYLGVYVLHIDGKEHSVHDTQSLAGQEYLRARGYDPLKYRR